ncbi:MAG TPA: hypothetical protein VHW69_07270 [Rhizomicrobium sp.]|jgi:hypothetical protein|nr:hypothetical protein [Rhizomicrobium sp.]
MVSAVSRRDVLRAAAGAAAVSGALAVQASDAKAGDASQLRKEDVRYQDQPKGEQSCRRCKNFVSPNNCKVVSGAVNPNGWCLLFQATGQ